MALRPRDPKSRASADSATGTQVVIVVRWRALHKIARLWYDCPLMPWDYTDQAYKKQAAADPVWHLERLINYGDGTERIDRDLLKAQLPHVKIPEDARTFLELIV